MRHSGDPHSQYEQSVTTHLSGCSQSKCEQCGTTKQGAGSLASVKNGSILKYSGCSLSQFEQCGITKHSLSCCQQSGNTKQSGSSQSQGGYSGISTVVVPTASVENVVLQSRVVIP